MWSSCDILLVYVLLSFVSGESGRMATGAGLAATANMEMNYKVNGRVVRKYVRGVYSTAGKVLNVEGGVQQLHPYDLCRYRPPALNMSTIYLLELGTRSMYPPCATAADKASIAITNGASAIILIGTNQGSNLSKELDILEQPLDRPVILIRDKTEGNKLFLAMQRRRVFMRIHPITSTVAPELTGQSAGANHSYTQEGLLMYLVVAVLVLFIIVLITVAVLSIKKSNRMRTQLQHSQARSCMLNSLGVHKYIQKSTGRGSASLESTPSPCPICLEQYNVGEELRLLPCTHQYHRICIDKWLMENDTCPVCCGQLDELFKMGRAHLAGVTYTNTPAASSNRASHISRHPTRTPSHSLQDSEAMRELLPPSEHQAYLRTQYEYLLWRLQDVRTHQLSASVSETEESARLSRSSTPYDIDSMLPSENLFIGDGCQGGIPRIADGISLSEIDIDIRNSSSSKSTLLSVESSAMSPIVSDIDTSGAGSLNSGCTHGHSGCDCSSPPSLTVKRTVRFREPESEVMSDCSDCKSCQRRASSSTRLTNIKRRPAHPRPLSCPEFLHTQPLGLHPMPNNRCSISDIQYTVPVFNNQLSFNIPEPFYISNLSDPPVLYPPILPESQIPYPLAISEMPADIVNIQPPYPLPVQPSTPVQSFEHSTNETTAVTEAVD